MFIRPEDIELSHENKGVVGEIKSVAYLGNIVYYVLSIGNTELCVQTMPHEVFEAGEKVYFNIRRVTKIEHIGELESGKR